MGRFAITVFFSVILLSTSAFAQSEQPAPSVYYNAAIALMDDAEAAAEIDDPMLDRLALRILGAPPSPVARSVILTALRRDYNDRTIAALDNLLEAAELGHADAYGRIGEIYGRSDTFGVQAPAMLQRGANLGSTVARSAMDGSTSALTPAPAVKTKPVVVKKTAAKTKPKAKVAAKKKTTTARPSEADLTLNQRKSVQVRLGLLGYDAGPADGIFGLRTRQAISAWQRRRGHLATGALSRPQFEELRQESSALYQAWRNDRKKTKKKANKKKNRQRD